MPYKDKQKGRDYRNQWKQRLRAKWKEQGKCNACGGERAENLELCHKCIEYRREYANKKRVQKDSAFYENQRAATKRHRKKWAAEGKCKQCGREPESGRTRCSSCIEFGQEKHRQRRIQDKVAVFEHYGGACSCCGETQLVFLAIDHINGGGTKHRKALGSQGREFYRWLRKQGFPDGYQILCHNCNFAKHLLGECPHTSSRKAETISKQ